MKTRMTCQRMKILEYLKSVETHPSAETVYYEVVKYLPAITLATVYRNLNLLAKIGEIFRLEINGEYRYDAKQDAHIHCVCTNCGKIIDVFKKDITKLNCKVKGFEPKKMHIILHGICAKCKEG